MSPEKYRDNTARLNGHLDNEVVFLINIVMILSLSLSRINTENLPQQQQQQQRKLVIFMSRGLSLVRFAAADGTSTRCRADFSHLISHRERSRVRD